MALPERLLRQVAPQTLARERVLPVLPALEPLTAGLRRGSTVSVEGSTTLALALAAGPSATGSWCAAVGMPALGAQAAAGLGVALERLALVPSPGTQWTTVVAALVDALDVVIVRPHPAFRRDAERLNARVRERGSVLVVCGPWPSSELRLRATARCHGAGEGDGFIDRIELSVVATGRGAASRERRAMVGF